jgi:16S rRNA (cytidine1402-2'-O)-methyltransferase
MNNVIQVFKMGAFYICPTPIGNLNDISTRLTQVLSEVDIVYAEDTRVAKKLLSHLNQKKEVRSYFKGNEIKKIDEILNFLEDDKSIAMISDAGTPLISDPGNTLVKELIKSNVEIVSIPGPSSVLVALTLSGFDTEKFTFLGFVPKSGKERAEFFNNIQETQLTLICFTSPKRLKKDLQEFVNKNIENEIVVCRELTKKFETIYRGTATTLLRDIPDNEYRGEVTLVINKSKKIKDIDIDSEDLAKKLIEYKVPKREIAKIISSVTKEKVNSVYDLIKNL